MKYLDYDVTKLPDSVEMLFCKPLDEKGIREKLDESRIKLLVTLIPLSEDSIKPMYDDIKSAYNLLSILEDRLNHINCKIDKAPMLFISLCCTTPGDVVMYTYYIAYAMKKHNIEKLSLEILCKEIFPDGLFTKDSLDEYWNKQKVNTGENIGGDNLLDYSKASESLISK